jgi:hypothetical protein
MAKKKTPQDFEEIVASVRANTRKRAYVLARDAYYAAGMAWIDSERDSDGMTDYMMKAVVDNLIVDGWRKVDNER